MSLNSLIKREEDIEHEMSNIFIEPNSKSQYNDSVFVQKARNGLKLFMYSLFIHDIIRNEKLRCDLYYKEIIDYNQRELKSERIVLNENDNEDIAEDGFEVFPAFIDENNCISYNSGDFLYYYALSPIFESHIQKEIILEENLSHKAYHNNPLKEDTIYGEFIIKKVKSLSSSLIRHSRLIFYLNEHQRQFMQSNIGWWLAKDSIINHMSLMKFDGVFTVKEKLIINDKYFFNLTYSHRQINYLTPVFVYEKDEIIIFEIKRSFDKFTIAKFIDNVMGFYNYFMTINNVLHLVIFYNQKNNISNDDEDFIQYLLGGNMMKDMWGKCWLQCKDSETISNDKKNYIMSSFEKIRQLKKNNKVIIDFIYDNTIEFCINTDRSQLKKRQCQNNDFHAQVKKIKVKKEVNQDIKVNETFITAIIVIGFLLFIMSVNI